MITNLENKQKDLEPRETEVVEIKVETWIENGIEYIMKDGVKHRIRVVGGNK